MTLEQEQEFLKAYQQNLVSTDELIDQYKRAIKYFLQRKRVRPDFFEDCYQDCLIILLDCGKSYDFRKAKFITYFFSQMRGAVTKYQRDSFYWTKHFRSLETLQEENGFDYPDDSIHDPVIAEFKERLKAAINSLTDIEKQIIYLHYFEDLSLQSTIAKMLKMNGTAVYKAELRALKKMRNILVPEEIDFEGI